jgi:hypothetical protein
MNILELLQGQLGQQAVSILSQQVGAPTQQTEAATNGILGALLGGLARNASSPEGADALGGALDQDHDGSVLGDLMGLLSGAGQAANPSALNGAGILNHILGGKQADTANAIGQASGLDAGTIMQMMMRLAPMVMGVLGQTKREQGLDNSGLASILGGTVQQQQESNPMMGMIGRILDRDGDGSYMDEVASMGMSLLGSFFKK